MEKVPTSFVLRSLGFSALAGMRSMSPPAMLSLYLGRRPVPRGHAVAERFRSPAARAGLTLMALGELGADKLPQTPDRTDLPPLLGRAASGAGVAALQWSLQGLPAWTGGTLGAAAAVAGSYIGFHFRAWLRRTLPGPRAALWAGVVEDAVTWLLGWWLLTLRRARR